MKHEGIPVLMYHSLSADGRAAGRSVTISTEAFRAQMEWLWREGYRTIDNETQAQYTGTDGQAANRHFKLTFDDGYYSWYRYAQDILTKCGFTATMFLSTAYVNGSYNIDDFKCAGNDRPLTWTEIKNMAANGWLIQAHGHHHYKWSSMPLSSLVKELRVCKNEIEQATGHLVDKVAYPYGDYNTEILQHLAAVGYQAGYTVHTGMLLPTADRYRIPRIEINSMDTMASFERKIKTGYASGGEAIRGRARNLLYANPRIKDLIKRVIG